MTRLSFSLSALVLVIVGGLLAAPPGTPQPKEPPKEPATTLEPIHAGKPLSDWLKQLCGPSDPDRDKAGHALREMARHSSEVVEKTIATAADPATNSSGIRALIQLLDDLGPAAVPALQQSLWSADERTRLVCLYAIRQIGADARSVRASLARLLSDPEEKIRREAVVGLRMIGSASAIPSLLPVLRDRSTDVRLETANSLIQLGAGAADVIPALLEIKGDESGEQVDATRLLGSLGPEAASIVPALVMRLPEAKTPVAVEIAHALGLIGPEAREAIPSLRKKLADNPKDADLMRPQVASALWRIGHDPAAATILRDHLSAMTRFEPEAMTILWRIDPGADTITSLTGLLQSDKPRIAITAAGLLGTKVKEAVPLLGKMLAHKDAQVRSAAIVALVRLGPDAKGAVDALRTAARDDVPHITFWATAALCRLAPTAENVAAVAGFLSDRDPLNRIQAAEVLGSLGTAGKPAVGKLMAVLEDGDEQVRLAVVVALWQIDRHPLTLSAAKLLRSSNPRIREQVALAIGVTFGAEGKPVVGDLVTRLFDPFSGVRSTSAEALGRIGPVAKEAVPALLALLEGDEPNFVQSASCEALGLIQPADKETTVALLKRKLEHPDALTRVHAALALSLIASDKAGEKEAERGLGYRTHPVRITAAEALWRMKQDGRVVPFLVRTLEDSNLEGTPSDNERYMAVRALGRIGPAAKPAIPELLKLLTYHDQTLAATARDAIKAISGDSRK